MESDIIHFMTCNKIISTFHSFFNVAAGFFRRNARSEGAAEGGRGGNSVAPERPAGAKRRRSLGVLRKMGSDFFEKTPPFQICQRSCLGASPLGISFRQEIPGGFEFRRKNSHRKSAVLKRSLDCAFNARANEERISEIIGVSAVQFNHAIL